jgi:hypothetical protein
MDYLFRYFLRQLEVCRRLLRVDEDLHELLLQKPAQRNADGGNPNQRGFGGNQGRIGGNQGGFGGAGSGGGSFGGLGGGSLGGGFGSLGGGDDGEFGITSVRLVNGEDEEYWVPFLSKALRKSAEWLTGEFSKDGAKARETIAKLERGDGQNNNSGEKKLQICFEEKCAHT